jgi:chromosome segregation ATPase
MRHADNTPMGKTLRSIYEFAIKRWKEAEGSEKEDRDAKKEAQETLDLAQRLDRHRSLVAETDYRMYQAQSRNTHASILRTSLNQEMASRQTRIYSLPRAEREKQEKWAQSQLKENAGNCVAGFG